MDHSWADGGYENHGPGASRGTRIALRVLILVVSALAAVVYAKMGMDYSRSECYANAPRGTLQSEIQTTFRWLPPGYDCSYAG